MTKYNKSGYSGHRGALSAGQKGFSGGGESCVPATGATTQVTFGTTNSARFPAYGLYNYGITIQLFTQSALQSALGAGQKRITSVEYLVNTGWTSPYIFNNQTIKMAHVDPTITDIPNNAWNATFDNAASLSNLSDMKTCKSNFTWEPSATSTGSWDTTTLDDFFCYNGTSGILLIWENNDGSWQSGYGTMVADYPGFNTAPFSTGYLQQDANFPTSSQVFPKYNFNTNVRLGN